VAVHALHFEADSLEAAHLALEVERRAEVTWSVRDISRRPAPD
jgi:hypothetical protein